MARYLSVEDILKDIEFEIAQGVISSEGIGQGIQSVRQFQNKTRVETFASLKPSDPHREILSRQFQINDMLLSLLQETALNVQKLHLEAQKMRQLAHRAPAPVEAAAPEAQAGLVARREPLDFFAGDYELRGTEEIENAMKPEAIQMDLQVRPIRWPVIGWLLTKLRIFYQRPALFYTQMFAHRQAPINRALGDRILYLESLVNEQHQQILALNAELIALQSGQDGAVGLEHTGDEQTRP